MPDEEENLHTATLDSSAVADHEVFMSWIRAGFERAEALKLLMDFKRHMYKYHSREDTD